MCFLLACLLEVRVNAVAMKIQVFLSNNILSEGIRRLVDECGFNADCEAVKNGSPAVEPDIVLFDSKKNIAELTVQHPQAKFILIDTGLKDLDLTCLLLCHHISGVIPPDAGLDTLSKALKMVYSGEVWIEQQYIKTLINKGQLLPDGEGVKGLSSQDKKIIALICRGGKNSEIANELCLSETTIKAHVSRIFKILKVRNRAQLVCLARDNAMNGDQ
jgi:DNA-binding NarL/FixJ family response regulator